MRLRVESAVRDAVDDAFEHGRDVVCRAGDSIAFPGTEPHTWVNESDEPCEVIWVLSPAPWSGSY